MLPYRAILLNDVVLFAFLSLTRVVFFCLVSAWCKNVPNLPASDFLSLTGYTKPEWAAFEDFLEQFKPHEFFKKFDMGWKDILLLTQLKLRQNLTYVILESLFKSDKSNLSRYVVAMILWQSRVANHCMKFDSRHEALKRRIHGFEDIFNDIDFRSVEHIIGMYESAYAWFKLHFYRLLSLFLFAFRCVNVFYGAIF